MTIALSTGMCQAMMTGPSAGKALTTKNDLISSDISFGSGDGTGGRDTINAASGLQVFQRSAWVQIFSPSDAANHNKLVFILSSTATKLELPAGTLTAAAAGDYIHLAEFDVGGPVRTLFKNSVLYLYTEPQNSSADSAEPGTPIVTITRNGQSFVAGNPDYGLNFGDYLNRELRRAIDPETANSEVWQGSPVSDGVLNSFMLCSNAGIRTASASAVRFTGRVGSDSAADLVMTAGTTVTAGVPVTVQTVRFQIRSGIYVAA